MEEALKCCPLCGAKPTMGCWEDALAQNGRWEIDCEKCNLTLTTYYLMDDYEKPKKADSKLSSYKVALKRWNRRKSA